MTRNTDPGTPDPTRPAASGKDDRGAAPHPSPLVSATVIDIAIRLGFIGLFIWVSLRLVAPFVPLAVWAVILTVAVYPIHQSLARWLGGRERLSALLLTLAGLLILLGPTAVLALSLVDTTEWLANGLSSGTLSLPMPRDTVRGWPLIGEELHQAWTMASQNLGETLKSNSESLLSAGRVVLGDVVSLGGAVLTFAAAIVGAGFLFRPGPGLVRAGRQFAERLASDRGGDFIDLAGVTIRNVSRGVIGVSMLQAALAGIGMALAGVPAAGALALAALILGIVQIGPGIVIFPVLIWAWASMGPLAAGLLTAYLIPVALVDNLLKPMVMSQGLDIPIIVILAGVIGGTLAYGLVGVFLGPIVLSVFYQLLVAWVQGGPPGRPPAP